MNVYKTKKQKITGSSFKEVNRVADRIFKQIKSRTKRTPYIRSKYFKGQKIFLNIFWRHLFDKRENDRVRRLKFFDCAMDLIRNTTYEPTTKENPNRKSELLHRFAGLTSKNEIFYIQIKEDKATERKDLLSVFPE